MNNKPINFKNVQNLLKFFVLGCKKTVILLGTRYCHMEIHGVPFIFRDFFLKYCERRVK